MVEFTGPPGAGKSTLMKRFASVAGNFSLRPIPTAPIGELEVWETNLLLARLARLIKDGERERIDRNVERIQIDSRARTLKGVSLIDEGLFMHWQPELIVFQEDHPLEFWNLVERRVVVNICTEPDDILGHIDSRAKETGGIWKGHMDWSESEIVAYHKEASEDAGVIADLVRCAGGRVYDIHTRDGLAKNVKQLINEIGN